MVIGVTRIKRHLPPVKIHKLHPVDKERYTSHHGEPERGAKTYHQNPNTKSSYTAKNTGMRFGKEEVDESCYYPQKDYYL